MLLVQSFWIRGMIVLVRHICEIGLSVILMWGRDGILNCTLSTRQIDHCKYVGKQHSNTLLRDETSRGVTVITESTLNFVIIAIPINSE